MHILKSFKIIALLNVTDSLFQINEYPYVSYLSVPAISTFDIFPGYREHQYTELAKPVFETKHFSAHILLDLEFVRQFC